MGDIKLGFLFGGGGGGGGGRGIRPPPPPPWKLAAPLPLIICEEAWGKGPIVSKYCFEKHVFKVSQIFRRHRKRDFLASK